jgi:integrase
LVAKIGMAVFAFRSGLDLWLQLQTYLARNHRPPRSADQPGELLITEVMGRYLEEHVATLKLAKSAKWVADMATNVLKWWGDKSLAEVNARNCREYVSWRTSQPIARYTKSEGSLVGTQTARHELAIMRAAIIYYHKHHGPLKSVPTVTLPPKSPPREDYFWSRSEAAKRIRAARRRPDNHHIVRLILLGLYSGTRPGAMLKLRWLPSTEGGWIDVDNEIIHRRARQEVKTKKKKPSARIHKRLIHHLRRWRREDMARGFTHVIHFDGKPINSVYRSWQSVRLAAGSNLKDGPHVLRHTAATWFMSWGVEPALISGYLGMSMEVLMDVYAHHHPMFQEAIAQATPKKQANQVRTK